MSVSNFLSHAVILRDNLLAAVALDAVKPLAVVPSAFSSSRGEGRRRRWMQLRFRLKTPGGAFCPSLVDAILTERGNHTEQLLREAIADTGSDRAAAALEAVAEQLELLVADVRDNDGANMDIVMALNAAIVKAQRYDGKPPVKVDTKPKRQRNRAKTTETAVKAIKTGADTNTIVEKLGISAANARQIRCRAKKRGDLKRDTP